MDTSDGTVATSDLSEQPQPVNLRLRLSRHQLVCQVDLLVAVLILQVFLYDHALIELALRLVTHLQLSMIVDFYDAPAPTQHKPVSFFAIPVGFVNLAYACYHLIVAAPDTRAPAAFVDFVGISHRASRLRMFSMDLLIFFLQLVFIILSHDYVTDIDASDLDPDTTPQTLFDQEDESTPQPPPTLPPDPYARPIFKLNYKSFYKRVTDWSAAMSSSFRTRPSTEVPSTLTDRGRSNRARMQRRGDPVGRAEDIEEEENTIGLNTSSRGAPSSNEPG